MVCALCCGGAREHANTSPVLGFHCAMSWRIIRVGDTPSALYVAHLDRILITGASGFVGQSLAANLASHGYPIRAATRRATLIHDTKDVVVVPDFNEEIDWTPILRDVTFVVHAAAIVHADARINSDVFNRVNRTATRQLARASAMAGVKRFIFISSIRAQAGACANDVLTESDEPRPTDAYGTSKLGGEIALHSAGVPFTIFRPVAIYGPHPKGNLATLLRLASLPIPLPFEGFRNRRSLLAIENLAAAVLFANSVNTVGETYVLADPEPISLRDMFITLRKALGRPPGQFFV